MQGVFTGIQTGRRKVRFETQYVGDPNGAPCGGIYLFGSDKTVAGNTAKILRNRLTHGFSKAAVEEIKRRKEELFGYMDLFLETILNADLTEKK